MCFPHKMWIKEWQRHINKFHDGVVCKEKYIIERIDAPIGYVYDDVALHRSFVSKVARADSLEVRGWQCYHICVDGGLIRYAARNYMGDYNYPTGRCDSIIFDRKELWFVEFKMNTTSLLDGQLWSDMSGGMQQLADFIFNLRVKMGEKQTPLHRYYSAFHQHCTLCMNKYPKMNASRNTRLEKFRKETGIKLQQMLVIP